MDETEYLLSSKRNAARILRSIAQIREAARTADNETTQATLEARMIASLRLAYRAGIDNG